MKGWKEYKIKEIGRVVTGNTPPRAKPEYYGNHTLFVKPTDIDKESKYTYNPEECYSELAFDKYKNSLIPKDATCVVTIGSIGEKITKAHCDLFINQAMNAVIPFEDFDEDFIYYLLKQNLGQLKLLDSGTASGRENVSKSSFSNIKVKLPENKNIQHKIAKILSAYDDLIENNLKRIKLLEEMAQKTYEEWFVRFKFPGHENAKFDKKTGLPEGWEKVKFKKILKFKTGKLDSNAHLPNGKYDFYTCAKEVFKTNTFCFAGEAILLGGNNATGNFALFYANSKFDAYQRTYIVTSNNLPLVYVFFVLKKYLPYFQNVSSGAATKFLTMRILNATKIVQPSPEILKLYESQIKSTFDLVINLHTQNQRLKEARDILLPRLMTGIIDVSDKKYIIDNEKITILAAEEKAKYNDNRN